MASFVPRILANNLSPLSKALALQGIIVIRLKYLSGMFFLFIIVISTSVSSEPNKESMLNEMQLLKQQYKLPSLSLAININKLVFADAVGYADINEKKLP